MAVSRNKREQEVRYISPLLDQQTVTSKTDPSCIFQGEAIENVRHGTGTHQCSSGDFYGRNPFIGYERALKLVTLLLWALVPVYIEMHLNLFSLQAQKVNGKTTSDMAKGN
jgi:hypothetical protein